MRRLKIGIRPQLIILVCFSSLFSLLTLAIVTAVYFSSNLSDLRAERLEVISQLKTTQVQQSLEFIFYQVYWLTSKDSITFPLSSYRAGNTTADVFGGANNALNQFIASSELFASARLYNLDLDVVASAHNNASSISTPAQDFLFPLSPNATIPDALVDTNSNQQGYFTGPVTNTPDPDSPYYMGITLPVFSNTSIILQQPTLAGYLTVLASAQNIKFAINDTTSVGSNNKTRDYTVIAVKPVFGDTATGINNKQGSKKTPSPIAFQTVFHIPGSPLLPNQVYNINSSSLIKEALSREYGSSSNVKSSSGKSVAIGFTQIQLDSSTYWVIIIEQARSRFLEPVVKLKNIIIAVVIGIGAFMCLITFPLAVWFIRPITKLKEATEAITRSKKQNKLEQAASHSSTSITTNRSPRGHPSPPAYILPMKNEKTHDGEAKRNSVHSTSTNTSGSAYSTGIRLPSRIPNSKKFFKDELTELSEAFNIMTEELDKQYTHLEDRVKSRTKELEASKIEAESANEAKTVFIANISHELRTPLNGILGMTAIAMDEEDQSRIQDSLKLIHRSGELLLHILTELLTYSKNTLNRSKLEKSNFQILEVVYQVKSIFNKLAMDQRVNFKILLRPNILRKLILYGDSNRIIQIVMNLVSNSLKFTPVDGSVDVTFKLLGEYDFERSKEDDFSAVHILKNSSTNSKSSNNQLIVPERTSFEAYYKNNKIHNMEQIANGTMQPLHQSDSSASLASTPKNDSSNSKPYSSSDNDNISIVTLSTTQYENKIFESQFNLIKPLPQLPPAPIQGAIDNSSYTELGPIQPPSDSSTTSVFRKDEDITYETANETNSSSSNGKKTDGSEGQWSSSTPQKIHTLPSRFERNSSFPSNMSNNELVKNNKAFGIRHMYKQKTWAIQIEVKDTGPGIEPALQEKVFEPFIQGDQTLSRSYGGTGLGLSICRQLALMMKGTLTLKSSVGVGSTFTFTVPLPQTGEIIVEDSEMAEFCEDEFNPKSRANRKVSFKTTELTEDDTAEHADHEYENDTSEESLGKQHEPPVILTEEVQTNNVYPQQPSLKGKSNGTKSSDENIETVIANTSNNSDTMHSSLLEKPRLVTRSSTGTASSAANSSDRADSHSNLHTDLTHLRILVAEDNLVNQEVIKRMLKLEGFTNVTMACNGGEAVDFVKESLNTLEFFDIILMDVQMPKIDGLLATKMIRKLHFNKPIIALTAFADESNVKECLSSGMSGFLAKPIRRTNLRKIISEFSPFFVAEDVTTPQTDEEKRLGHGNASITHRS
jgi:osomolarity two-component system sensor histidine kinase SLN1